MKLNTFLFLSIIQNPYGCEPIKNIQVVFVKVQIEIP